ncbi:hypothetical protein AB1Y20_021121 [Prymnesium parvum]|uniref:Uncharacterized protein n=1 Tax=Prymnesium parvum TaxID=97485 RepID=A0AB34JKF4_PRYPA
MSPDVCPPIQASAQEVFPAELALHALYASRYDVTAARALIEESTRTRNHNDWTKVEERHCRSAMGKVGKDSSSYRIGKEASQVREASSCGLIRKIQESVKTKSLDAVTRFFYVELGMRKKAKRERKRELELLAHERGGYRAGSTTPPY